MNSRKRVTQAVCLGLTLTFVPAILCAVTVASGEGLYVEFKDWQWRKNGDHSAGSTYESLVVDYQGRAAVAVHDPRGNAVRHLDAKRSTITVDEHAIWLVGSSLFRSRQPVHLFHRPREFPIEPLGRGQRDEEWFFVCDERPAGRAVFEMYDAVTHRPAGFIGREGYEAGPRDESKGFPVNGPSRWDLNPVLFSRSDFDYRYQTYERANVAFDKRDVLRSEQWCLRSLDQLFIVDLAVRSVTELLPGMRVHSLAPASRVVPTTHDPEVLAAAGIEPQFEYQKWLAVRTTDKVVIINPHAGRREEFVLPAGWQDRDFDLYLPSDGTAVLSSYNSKLG